MTILAVPVLSEMERPDVQVLPSEVPSDDLAVVAARLE